MTLKQTNQRGFTIVELLIVVVVIAILAAITIVAYNGIQNRARTSSGQAAANSVAKKAESYNAITGQYPTREQLTSNTAPEGFTGSLADARLDNTSIIRDNIANSTQADNGKNVVYVSCGTTGARVGYWDYTASGGGSLTFLNIGDATNASSCS